MTDRLKMTTSNVKFGRLINHGLQWAAILCSLAISILALIYISRWAQAGGPVRYSMDGEGVEYTFQVFRARTELRYQGLKDSLVTQVDKYIQAVAPGSLVNGIVLVEECDEYDIDLRFVLAQGTVESHWATKGIARKTNSVFNVHSFDGRTASEIRRAGLDYSHPDKSIEPYLQLLQSRYLVGGKTEEDMFVNFTDSLGQRYASNRNYEKLLLDAYNKIDEIAPMGVYDEYMKYKVILGR